MKTGPRHPPRAPESDGEHTETNSEEDEVAANHVEDDDEDEESVVVSVEEDDDDGVVDNRDMDDEYDQPPTYEESQEPMVHSQRHNYRTPRVADVFNSSQRGRMCTQCGFCVKRFESQQDLDTHTRFNNSGCAVHRICFPSKYNYYHARDESHERCFVPGCESPLTRSGGWSNRNIEDHVSREHRLRSDP